MSEHEIVCTIGRDEITKKWAWKTISCEVQDNEILKDIDNIGWRLDYPQDNASVINGNIFLKLRMKKNALEERNKMREFLENEIYSESPYHRMSGGFVQIPDGGMKVETTSDGKSFRITGSLEMGIEKDPDSRETIPIEYCIRKADDGYMIIDKSNCDGMFFSTYR